MYISNIWLTKSGTRINSLIFDVCNDQYDFTRAYIEQDLQVILVDYGCKGISSSTSSSIVPPFSSIGSEAVAKHHNLNGLKPRPPFLEDHTHPKPPFYCQPRDSPLLSTTDAKSGWRTTRWGDLMAALCHESVAIVKEFRTIAFEIAIT